MHDLDERVADAVRHFWQTRAGQGRRQGTRSGRRDYGNRAVATGGKQLDGFNTLVADLLVDAGLPSDAVFQNTRLDITLPGFFRPTKQWDLVVAVDNALLAAVEFKSLCGPSFGNNYNNRVEEALGSATDLWTAYREDAFPHSPRPYLGYLLVLEDADASTKPVAVHEKHFRVFEPFRGASYAMRCEESLRRLVRERCYDVACLILTAKTAGARGDYGQPARDLTIGRFTRSLCNQVVAAYRSL